MTSVITPDRTEFEPDVPESRDSPPSGVDRRTTVLRTIAAGLATAVAALALGGIFEGAAVTVTTVMGGFAGAAVALVTRRVRNSLTATLMGVAGVFAIGLGAMAPSGIDLLPSVVGEVTQAVRTGEVLRPPVSAEPGWHVVTGWVAAALGFASLWTMVVAGRPRLGILVPLPVAVLAAVSLPETLEVGAGAAALGLLATAFAVLAGEAPADDAPPIGYDLRRSTRAVVTVGLVTALVVLLTRADVLFPDPIVDPTREPQEPETVPLSEVEDRVLFTVDSSLSGPWRIGSLDVYDGRRWLLPPLADADIADVPRTGIVNPRLDQGESATFHIAALDGAVLPALPNTVGIRASGPRLTFDQRAGSLRLAEGRAEAGLDYTVTAASLPSVDELRTGSGAIPAELRPFTEIPEPPGEVQRLLQDAAAQFDSVWDRLDFVRSHLLATVTAEGAGRPVEVTPGRVADMLAGSRAGSPFEIVAAQTMLARWLGVPARIGYGFDGGEDIAGRLEVHPRHGAAFTEVWFPDHEWIAVTATPRRAQPTVGGDESVQQFDPDVVPGEDAGVELFLPLATETADSLSGTALAVVGVVAALLALAGLGWFVWPVFVKARRRSRRRGGALTPRDRVVLAYTEWRETAADYGHDHPGDTPLAFLQRVVSDEEHRELAWLVTRTMWGDLAEAADERHGLAAEELSRSLRRRLLQIQPAGARVAAAVSRASLAASLDAPSREREDVAS